MIINGRHVHDLVPRALVILGRSATMKKGPIAGQQLSFHAVLENWAEGMNHCAVPVPASITAASGTTGPVLVLAQVNESEPFQVSLFPVGGGQHYLRIKAKVRQETNTTTGDRIRVRVTVLDRAHVEIPDDLRRALAADQVLEPFMSLPPGHRAAPTRATRRRRRCGVSVGVQTTRAAVFHTRTTAPSVAERSASPTSACSSARQPIPSFFGDCHRRASDCSCIRNVCIGRLINAGTPPIMPLLTHTTVDFVNVGTFAAQLDEFRHQQRARRATGECLVERHLE